MADEASTQKVQSEEVQNAGESQPGKAQPPDASQNVDQIRDILFGGQMRDYERRFARMEEESAKELARVREDMDKRLKALQQLVAKEVDALSDRLKADARDNKVAQAALSKDIEKNAEHIDSRLSELEENYAKQLRQMRQQTHDNAEAAEEALRRVQDEVVALIRGESEHLTQAKVDRVDLAGMLTEVAMRLNKEFELPGGT
ncbi:MAG: hypothetical protein GKR94_06530 [Gammaproteobacteria bacterium]|nr:hypothetical protein [Gammaproteobacteria bacterium]